MTGSPPHSRRMRWLIIIVVLFALIAGLWWWLSHRSDEKDAADGKRGESASTVSTIAASREDFPVYLTALGTVNSLHNVAVRPRVEGELLSVDFQEGQRVEKGQVLARIDPRTYQAQLDQAKGQLEQDQAQLANARQDLERYRKLARTNAISRQDLETQQQLVNQYQGTVTADRASVQNAQVELDYTTIEAPITGRVGIRNVDPGNIVQLGDEQPIATITQLAPISVLFSMPSQYRAPVQAQLDDSDTLPVVALNSDESDTLATGQLASIDSRVDTATGTVRMRARFANADLALFPNAFVNIRLRLKTLGDAVVIPLAAVQTGEDGNYVYVLNDDDTVSRHAVSMAASDDLYGAVDTGVSVSDRVVVDGIDRLRDGAKVKVVSHSLPGEADPEQRSPGSAAGSDKDNAGQPSATNDNAPSGKRDSAS